MTSEYDRLGYHLATLGAATITLTFAEIEAIVGPLPAMARRDKYWWGATALARYASAHIHAWWQAGYIADRPDFTAETVTFRRVAKASNAASRRGADYGTGFAHERIGPLS